MMGDYTAPPPKGKGEKTDNLQAKPTKTGWFKNYIIKTLSYLKEQGFDWMVRVHEYLRAFEEVFSDSLHHIFLHRKI